MAGFASLASKSMLNKGMADLSPLISEFATTEEAEAYDLWFRAKVQASLDDRRPNIPHDEAMARVRTKIEAARQQKKP